MGRRVLQPGAADLPAADVPAADLAPIDSPASPVADEPPTDGPVATAAEPATAKPRGVFYYLGLGLSGGLFVLMLALAAAVIVVPAATGSVPLTVLTSSMEPTLPAGTLIVVRPVEVADIRIGDAITYQIESGKPEVVTHRVISITSSSDGGTSFITQGDNNDAPDARPVVPEQVQGRVWYSVPWLGWVNSAVNGESRTWVVPVIAGGLFLYAGYMIAGAVVDGVKKRRIRNRELTDA